MPADIRLIGLDLDNTTLNAKKQITPRVAAAIEAAIRAGIVVLPATGRPLSGITPQFLAIPGVRYALTANGAKVYDLQQGEAPIIQNCFSVQQAVQLYDRCVEYRAITAAFIDGVAYGEAYDFSGLDGMFTPQTLEYLKNSRKTVPNLRQRILDEGSPVEKMSLIFPSLEVRAVALEAFERDERVSATYSLGNNIELNTPTANKGWALLQLGRLLGIGQPQVMAVGDSVNDLEMLRAAGYAVAMQNAMPEVLALAHHVTASAEEDGVALAIEGILPG